MEPFEPSLPFDPAFGIALVYFVLISLVSVIVTSYDKIASKKMPKHRTPEKTLLTLSALGGSVAMLFTMLLIRHKTKHKKFMLGIPVMIVVQILVILGVLWLYQLI